MNKSEVLNRKSSLYIFLSDLGIGEELDLGLVIGVAIGAIVFIVLLVIFCICIKKMKS